MRHIVKFDTFYVYDGEGQDIREYWEQMTRVRLEFFEEPVLLERRYALSVSPTPIF